MYTEREVYVLENPFQMQESQRICASNGFVKLGQGVEEGVVSDLEDVRK